MLVETTVSHASVEDAQDALAGLKNITGFVLGYVVPGNPKTRLVFLCHCAGGNVVRTQKLSMVMQQKMLPPSNNCAQPSSLSQKWTEKTVTSMKSLAKGERPQT